MNALKNFGAVRALAATFGIWCGISGLEHGFFEILQGNVVPKIHIISGKPFIYAIGEANRFWQYGFEYAYTIIPNFFITGILAMTAGILVLIWSAFFIQKKYGWIIFILLSIIQYYVGGGSAQFGPALIVGIVASRIDKPLKWWRILPLQLRLALAKPWLGLISILLFVCFNGMITAIFGWFYGVKDQNLIIKIQWIILYVLMCLLPLSIISVLSKDSLNKIESNP